MQPSSNLLRFALTISASILVACPGGRSSSGPAPHVTRFDVAPRAVLPGGSALLSAAFENGVATIDHGVGRVESGRDTTVAPGETTVYTLTVTAPDGRTVSQTATVSVNVPPIISEPPRDVTVAQAATSTLHVTATGNGTLTYQWEKDGVTLAGQTSASLTLSNVQPADAGSYRVVVTNAIDTTVTSTMSSSATVTVNVPPVVTAAPRPLTVVASGAATFSVSATGSGTLTYQWLKDGVPLVGATLPELTISGASSVDEGIYACVVSNVLDGTTASATSEAASLVVNTPPGILTPPRSLTAVSGGSASFSVVATANGALSYQWQKDGADLVGRTSETLTLADVQPSSAGTYRVLVTNTLNGTVTTTPSPGAQLAINAPPSIVAQPQPLTSVEGQSASFTVSASGRGTLTWAWEKDGVAVPGADSATLYLASVRPGDAGAYRAVVTSTLDGTAATTRSASAALTVNSPPQITAQPQSATVIDGRTATFTVQATGSGALAYQWQRDGSDLVGQTSATLTLAIARPGDAGTYRAIVTNSLNGTVSQTTSAGATLVIDPSTCEWSVARSESLMWLPAGAWTEQGSWNDQGVANVAGRYAWSQDSEWNRLSVPAGLETHDVVSVAVEVYVPPHGQPAPWANEDAWTATLDVLGVPVTLTITPNPAATTLSAGGGTASIADPAGSWHRLAVEGRRSTCAFTATVDDIVALSWAGGCAASGATVELSSTNTNAFYSTPGIAWSNLAVSYGSSSYCIEPAGPPARMSAVSAVAQVSGPSRTVEEPPAVLVEDAHGHPVPGVDVTFTTTQGDGYVTGSPARTDTKGIARARSWYVGTSGTQVVEAMLSELRATFTTNVRASSARYDVTLDFMTTASDAQVRAFDHARTRIEQSVVGELPDIPLAYGPMAGCANLPASGVVDDLRIAVIIEAIDGPYGTLAQAGPCVVRTSSGLPVFGVMRFDVADLARLEADGTLESVVLHEMMHVIGFGTTWPSLGLLAGAGTADPYFPGTGARAAFSGFNGGSSYGGATVPVENTGAAGTINSHWREAVFGRELMTGWLSGTTQPMCRTTIASLGDLGYQVDLEQADAFDISAAALQAPAEPASWIGDEQLIRPESAVDTTGEVTPVAR